MNRPRGDEKLRGHRVSIVGASYFITTCVHDRKRALTVPAVGIMVNEELRGCETSGHIELLASTLMPDHLHVLFRLVGALPVERVVARLKSKTRAALAVAGASWQPNFFEHRLRPDEPFSPVLRYMLENPYRQQLVARGEPWPWFWCSTEIHAWFDPTTDDGRPLPEWLARDA